MLDAIFLSMSGEKGWKVTYSRVRTEPLNVDKRESAMKQKANDPALFIRLS